MWYASVVLKTIGSVKRMGTVPSPFRQYMESATGKESDLFAKQNVRGSAYGSNP